jgi:hypothetical protein
MDLVTVFVGISVQYIKKGRCGITKCALERRAREQIRSPGPFQRLLRFHSRWECGMV